MKSHPLNRRSTDWCRVVPATVALLLSFLPVLSRADIFVLPAGTTNDKFQPALPIPDNRTYDATAWKSTAVGPAPSGTTYTAVEIGNDNSTAVGTKNTTWMGGVIKGSIPTTWGWKETHAKGGAGVVIHNSTFAEWHHLRVHNVEDGIKPREGPEYSNTGSWMLRDSYFTAIRDDCIENDRFEPGTVQDCLFDGVHTFMSEQNENVPVNTNQVAGEGPIYVKRVYVRIYPTNAFTPNVDPKDLNPGGGKWFKWDPKDPDGNSTALHPVQVEDSVFAVGAIPRSGWGNLNIPSQVTWIGTNNYILWLGTVGEYGGPMPGVAGSNVPNTVTFLQGTAAHDKWKQVRNQWLISHGLPSQNDSDADQNPHLLPAGAIVQIPVDSLAPAAPTGLTATPGNGQVSLDWANNSESDLAGYNVYRSQTSGGPYNLRNSSLLTASAYTDGAATNGTTYFYVVTAADNAANESVNSAQVSATPAAGGSPSVYDANQLTIFDSSGKVPDSVSNPDASGGNFLRYKGNAVNDWISFTVTVPTTGTYTISVRYAKIPYGGKVQLSIFDPNLQSFTNQGSLSDTYAPSAPTAPLASFTLGTRSLTAGTHTFKFQSTAKNASSSGYYIAIDTITLTP